MTVQQSLTIKRLLEGNFLKVKEQDDEIYVAMLSEYDFEKMQTAVKNFILKSKFPPTIADLVEEYKKLKDSRQIEIVNQMKFAGIFRDNTEYEKALSMVERGIIPDWFQKMMDEFRNNYLQNSSRRMYLGSVGDR